MFAHPAAADLATTLFVSINFKRRDEENEKYIIGRSICRSKK
jgi:hypothetical protein